MFVADPSIAISGTALAMLVWGRSVGMESVRPETAVKIQVRRGRTDVSMRPESGSSEAQNDRFFRHLVLNLRTGVVAIYVDGRIAAINDIAYRVLGLIPHKGDVGRPFVEVLQDCPEVTRVLQQAFDTDDLPNRAEMRLRKTGREIGRAHV